MVKSELKPGREEVTPLSAPARRAARSGIRTPPWCPARPWSSSVTVPPCSSTNERTIDSPRPAPRWREPCECDSNQSNTRSCTSGGMPGPLSVTVNTTASGRRSAASVMVAPGGEKPTALARRLNSTCRMRRSSAAKLPMSDVGADVERDVVLDQAVADALGRGVHGAADVDRAEIELHRAGVDGGEIEDVVDDRQQRVGRGVDVAEIFALLGAERADARLAHAVTRSR